MRVAFVGGARWSPGTGRVENRSVVFDGGRIVALDIDPAGAEQVEVGPGLVVPGFIDAHVHPVMAGHRVRTCDLTDIDDRHAALRHISERAGSTYDGSWLTGGGWLYPWFDGGNPDARLLDDLAPGRPVVLDVRDGHSSWANTAALAVAGITAQTPDPPDGRIERRADGSPQGTLHEGAMRLVESVVPPPSAAESDEARDVAIARLQSLGITGIQDAWVTDEEHGAWMRQVGGPDVVGALWWDRGRGAEQIPDLVDRSKERGDGYRPTAVKLMLDGVCEIHTAALGADYVGLGHRGLDFIEPALVAEAVIALDALGLQCHFHAIGDRAVRSALDAVAAARTANGWTGPLHHIAHLQIVDPVDIPRFAHLRVAATIQPLWACNEEAMVDLTLPFVDDDRAGWMYPFASLRRAGALLAGGSDWPVSTPSVMEQASVAMRRRPPDDDEMPPLSPAEALDLDAVLEAFTLGSARVNAIDRGRIRIGNVADLALLERDPFGVADPAGVDVSMTVLAGEIVHRKEKG